MEDLNKYLDNIGEKRDTLRHYLLKTHAECKFTDQELDNALDLAARRGGTGIGLIKDAEEFLYC